MHRDADGAGPEARTDEIARAVAEAGCSCPVVPVVPVRTTETWLLLDEQAIRRVAGNPSGRVPLELPSGRRAESVADPKEALRRALLDAAEVTGRSHKAAARRFPQHRRQLLQRLDVDGAVSLTHGFTAFREETARVAALLTAASS